MHRKHEEPRDDTFDVDGPDAPDVHVEDPSPGSDFFSRPSEVLDLARWRASPPVSEPPAGG